MDSIIISIDGNTFDVPASEFGLEEDGDRNLGDGDRQYESLFVYFDPDERFQVNVEATRQGNQVETYEARLGGDGEIIEGNLEAKPY